MIPTFLIGDFLLVNKFCYGYSNDSFRLASFTFPLPTIRKRLFAPKLPERGDVIVFRNEKDQDKNYVKRIIGLPGDTIQLIGGIVYINSSPVKIKQTEDYNLIEDDECQIYKKYIETLPNGYEHVILKMHKFGQAHLDNVGPFVVPTDHYFCMGDNRDNSLDSRVMELCGFVPLSKIMGRAECLFFSSSCSLWEVFKWPFSIRVKRIFTAIH
jgi:signal peptidase I